MDRLVKVLIVDDSSDIRELVSLICERHGWETCLAKDGKDAVDKIKEDKDISFVFMDINMPVMNGFIAARKIKEFNSSIPVIALSSESKYNYVDNLGGYKPFDDFISKDEISEIITLSNNYIS